jgi:hypothetical protein
MEVANKRRFVYPSHLQHVAFRTRDVRYAVFKERAPHPGPAEAIGHSDALRFRETRLAAYSLKTKQRDANRPRRVSKALWDPDGHRGATSFVFDLETIGRVSIRSCIRTLDR